MGLYQDHVLPLLIHLSMRQRNLAAYRARVVPAAQGRVLEIGIGSGLNLPYYGTAVEQIIGLDPSPKLLAMAREAARQTAIPLELIENSAETIPLYNRSIDTVVTTWTICSIPDVQRALGEMRRILKPGGRLLFVEHGRSPDAGVRRWQDRLTPVWRRIGGGCHLNRAISEMIESTGFRIERVETGYMRGPKPMTFMYEGAARPR
ncbi:MAG: Ubiquinone/menaquinone biosynthesis C-methyltransferase UbiE [Pseudorhodoplanes sp.]|nr:Ubiquinone/menaquinone biosynthesis C-methyltransferase UbiE [Pseudorhodoplanes sp.]